MDLSASDIAALGGELGEARRLCMELVVAVGRSEGAPHLTDIVSAHIDGCLYHGEAGLDFAGALVEGGGVVAVPTTLNVSSLDLLHPELYRGEPETAEKARRLMDAYVDLGCRSTWTCAPYQLINRPGFGDQIAWGESNAIVFANSVLGARTNRYGDFLDICCAITGRAPMTGLHTDSGRKATLVVELELTDPVLDHDLAYALIGHVVGRLAGTGVPALVGLDHRASEDRLKSLGAAAASSGSVAMFHAVGVTPEAADLESVLCDAADLERRKISLAHLTEARDELSSPTGVLGAVSIGTPHMSLLELTDLARLVEGRRSKVPFYANTARETLALAEERGLVAGIESAGVTLVTDTCTYITPIMGEVRGDLMTNSGKLAYYAPANLGVTVALGSLVDCVESAMAGRAMSVDSEWWE